MIDPCKFLPPVYLMLRDAMATAIGVIEAPSNIMFDSKLPLALDKLTTMEIDETSPYVVLEGTNDGHDMKFRFTWNDWVCDEAAPATSPANLFSGESIGVDPITRDEAIEALLLGYVDFFKCTGVEKHGSGCPLKAEFIYVGKVEPDSTADFPVLPEEPVDSHIHPKSRPSRLDRITREREAARLPSPEGFIDVEPTKFSELRILEDTQEGWQNGWETTQEPTPTKNMLRDR